MNEHVGLKANDDIDVYYNVSETSNDGDFIRCLEKCFFGFHIAEQ